MNGIGQWQRHCSRFIIYKRTGDICFPVGKRGTENECKKTYKPTKGYTPLCKIGECSLKRLEFGIIELDAGNLQDFDTLDKETAFIMLEGHCNVRFGDTIWERVGNRNTVFENRRAESFYMPAKQKLLIEALDHVKIAVCAAVVDEKHSLSC